MAGTVKCWTNQNIIQKGQTPDNSTFLLSAEHLDVCAAPSLFRGLASIVNTSIVHLLFYTYEIHYSIQHASSLTISVCVFIGSFLYKSYVCVCICVCAEGFHGHGNLHSTVVTCCRRPLQ